jgi:hypothetical protein
MSRIQEIILGAFGGLTAIWVVWSIVWLVSQRGSGKPSLSLRDLKAQAELYSPWYLSPLSNRAVRIWKYVSWIVGGTWLIVGYLARQSVSH